MSKMSFSSLDEIWDFNPYGIAQPQQSPFSLFSSADSFEDLDPVEERQESSVLQDERLLDDSFHCPICTDVFKTPKILFCCGRSICASCENRILRRSLSVQNCPMCNTHGQIKRFSSLKVNVDLQKAIEAMKQAPQHQSLCEDCEQPVEVDHVYSCETCYSKNKICSRCILKKHRYHKFADVKYVSQERREAVVSKEKAFKTANELQPGRRMTETTKKLNECLRRMAETSEKILEIRRDVLTDKYQTERDMSEKLERARELGVELEKHKKQLSEVTRNLTRAGNT